MSERVTGKMLRPSVLLALPGRNRMRHPPKGFSAIPVTEEQRGQLNKIAIETFMELANGGLPFADCLGSLLLTGIHFGSEAQKEQNHEVS